MKLARSNLPIAILCLLAAACGPKGTIQDEFALSYNSPHSIVFEEAQQTVADDHIERAARKQQNDSDVVTVRNIVNWFRHKTVTGGRRHFLERPATLLYHDRNLSGCIDTATLFAAFTRSQELLIPTVFVHAVDVNWAKGDPETSSGGVRISAHTFLELFLDGSWYLLDPTASTLYLEYETDNPSLPGGYVVHFKGADMWGGGMTSKKTLEDSVTRFLMEYGEDLAYEDPGYRAIDLSTPEALHCYLPLTTRLDDAPAVLEVQPASCPRTGLKIETEGLSPVGPGGYALVAIYGKGGEEQLASFNVRKGVAVDLHGTPLGLVPLPRYPGKVKRLEIRYDPGPAHNGPAPVLLSGIFGMPHATRMAFAVTQKRGRLSKMPGAFLLDQKGEGASREFEIQVSAGKPREGQQIENETGSRDFLAPPPLKSGWTYELWLTSEADGVPTQVSLGRADGADNCSGGCDGPWFSGPSTLALLAGGELREPLSLFVTVEPEPDPTPDEPFYLVILEGLAAAGTQTGEEVPLRIPSRPAPRAVVRAVW